MQITDLSNATQTKSAAEVTKMFVDSASYILRAAVGGTGGKGKASESKRGASKSSKPLWDKKKLKVDDFFSCISYLKVAKIDGDKITVDNHLGGSWFISNDILKRDMWSADHFDKEVKCSMTDLCAILQKCSDTIFSVSFRKKVDEKTIESKLQAINFNDLKKADQQKKIAKDLILGELTEITGHIIESDNNLGRSVIIDLNQPLNNNVR